MITLTGEERERLTLWAAHATSWLVALRVHIVLACADNPQASDDVIATQLKVNPETVRRWRKAFTTDRVHGLLGRRPATRIKLGDEERATLLRWNRSTQAPLAARAAVILACADNPLLLDRDIATLLKIHRTQVANWRSKFIARRLEGLLEDLPQPVVEQTSEADWVAVSGDERYAASRAQMTATFAGTAVAAASEALTVEGLDEKHRQVLRLRVENPRMSQGDLARLAGIPRNVLNSRLRRALAAARKLAETPAEPAPPSETVSGSVWAAGTSPTET